MPDNDLPTECCAKCRFGFMPKHFPDDRTVLCRRRAPTRVTGSGDGFPAMHWSQWCGEFEAVPGSPADQD